MKYAYSATERGGKVVWEKVGEYKVGPDGIPVIRFDLMPGAEVVIVDPMENPNLPIPVMPENTFCFRVSYCPKCGNPKGKPVNPWDSTGVQPVRIGRGNACPSCHCTK